MYTLRICNDNSVVTSTSDIIMQRSNYVDNICILSDKFYKDIDMTDASVLMQYVLPISKKICSTFLTLTDENYKGQNIIKYVIPANTLFTAEYGDIEVTFSFVKLAVSEDGTQTAYTRKTQDGIIRITPISNWSEYVPDELLSPIDQRLIMLEAMQKDLEALAQENYENRATDIAINSDKHLLHLIARNGQLGNGMNISSLSNEIIKDLTGVDPDGIQDGVVDLDTVLTVDLNK